MELEGHYTEWISGPISYYIIGGDDVRFYLFGDRHTDYKSQTCDKIYGMRCNGDSKRNNGSKCKTITTLLLNWFDYNKDYHISTDFYLEIPFTKEDGDEGSKRIIKKDISWLNIVKREFEKCFTMSKRGCEYIPDVRMHYIDVRLQSGGYTGLNNPFKFRREVSEIMTTLHFASLETEGDDSRINDIWRTLEYKFGDMIDSLNDSKEAIDLLYLSDVDINNTKFAKEVSRFGVKRDGKLMTRPAAEYNRLKEINSNVADKLREFVYDHLKSMSGQLRKLNIMNVVRSRDINKLRELNPGVYSLIVSHDAIIMDIYTISRIFVHFYLNKSEQIIIFTGYVHIERYYRFLVNYLGYNSIYEYTYNEKRDKCVKTGAYSTLNK